jgi:preprotein translocase subunit Sss1
MTPKAQRTVSKVIGAIGMALVVMMITTEGELGLLPLGLMLLGAIGYVTAVMREKRIAPK